MTRPIRILFLADSHLGFDLPARPRTKRRRRGEDFLSNHEAALERALAGDVDVVVHGGDVFDRPDVHELIAWRALRPLVRVADAGVPVFIVPGNHERARIPHMRMLEHPLVHVFERPRTFTIDVRGMRLALSGFPFERRIRSCFPEIVGRTGWQEAAADVRMLCMHQCAEGATVGPGDFTFTTAPDVVRTSDVPAAFTAVLSGHIHRHQVLITDLRHQPLEVPVLYPGSVERTSLAEIGEKKGWIMLDINVADQRPRMRWDFHELPTRPMLVRDVVTTGRSAKHVDENIRAIIAAAPVDAVLRIRIDGDVTSEHLRVLRAAHVRTFVPDTMNLEIRGDFGPPYVAPSAGGHRIERTPAPPQLQPQLDLGMPV